MKKSAVPAVALAACIMMLFPSRRAPRAVETGVRQFTVQTEVWRTPYKPQGQTGMCWAFSTTSFLESELKRLGRGEFELSQVFFAYCAYLDKARRYAHRQGGGVFGQGGLPHDVINVIREYGAMPLSVYSGLSAGEQQHAHGELFAILDGVMNGVIDAGERGILSGVWRDGELHSPWFDDIRDILDNHLGSPPESFEYGRRTWTPRSFADDALSLPLGDYVEITSYSCLPMNGRGELLLHDNWLHYGGFYNISLDDYMAVIDHALANGFSLVFDMHTTAELYKSLSGYAELSEDLEERGIDADARDTMLEDWSTTDVHLVHCVGTARDGEGKPFYLIKDSWGADEGPYRQLEYLSQNYVRAKVLFIMLHREGIPREVRRKLGLD